MYEVGNAFIQIIPSFENIEKHLAKGAKDIADQVGKAVGDALPAGFEDGVKKGTEQAEKQARTGGRKAAESYAGHFSDLLQKRMAAVARALPELKIDGDLTQFDERLSQARKRVLELADKPLSLDVDASKTLRDVSNLREELRQLRAQTSDNRLKLDLDVATAQVDKFLDEAHSVTERIGRDFSGAFDKILQNGLGKALSNLPDAEINVDIHSAEGRLAELRRVLHGLSEQTVGIDISEQDAMTVLHGVRSELSDISRTAESMQLRINADQTLRGLDATMAKLVTVAEEEAAKAAEDERKRREKQAEQDRKDRIKAAERERAELARADREDQKRREREAQQYWREQTKLADQHLKEKRQLQEKAAQEEKKRADDAAREQERREREAARVAEEQFSRTFAGRISKHLEKAYSSLPDVNLSVNAADADFALKSIRDELKRLSTARIGIDIDAADAQAHIAFIKNELIELARSNPTIDVHADAVAAATELAAIERIAARLNDQDVTVKVHSTGSDQVRKVGQEASVSLSRLEQLIAVGVSLGTSLVPAAAAAATAIGFIGTAAASVTSGIGVMALGFSGIGDAVKAMQKLDEDSAKSQASNSRAASQVVNSLDAINSAERSLANTRANNAEAARRAARAVEEAERAVGDARRAAAEAVKQALEKENDAERTLTRTHLDAREAREGLNRAYREAVDALADLDSAVKRNAIDQRQANLDIKEAKQELDAFLANPRASEAEREQAQITYERRLQQIKDLERQGKQLAAEQAEANRKGVQGSDQVVAARKRIADADERVAAAQRSLDRAREDVIRAQVDGQRRVEDAQRRVTEAQIGQQSQARQAAFSLAEAQRSLAAAHRQAEQAAVRQGVAGGEALSNLETVMGKLSPAAQNFAKFLFGLRDEVKSLRDVASTNMLPGVQSSIETLLPYLPRFREYVGRVASAIGDMFRETSQFLSTDPTWRRFFGFLDKETVPTLERLYRMGRNVATGLAGLFVALTPFNDDIGGGLEHLTERFAKWATTLEQNQGFQAFLDYARENGPKVVELIGQLVEFATRFVIAAAPTGSLVVSAFTALARALNGLPMWALQSLVVLMAAWSSGLLLLNLRTRLLAINAAFTNRIVGDGAKAMVVGAVGAEALGTATERAADRTGRFNKAMSGAKTAAGAVRTGVGNLAGFLAGPWGLAIAGAALAVSYFANRSEEQKKKVSDLAEALKLLGDAYRQTKDISSTAVKDVVAQSDELQNLINNSSLYGLAIEDVAKAAAGEADAQQRVIEALKQKREWYVKAGTFEGSEQGLTAFPFQDEVDGIDQVVSALQVQFEKTRAAATAQDALNAAQQRAARTTPSLTTAQFQLWEKLSLNEQRIAALKGLIDTFGNSQATAAQKADALRAAIEEQTGAAKNSIEAQESLDRANLNLRNSVEAGRKAGLANKDALTAQTQEAFNNRDALEEAATAVRERFLADVASGVPMAKATADYQKRIEKLQADTIAMGLDEKQVKDLIAVYGKVDPKVTTVYETKGFDQVFDELEKLQVAQWALKNGVDPKQAWKDFTQNKSQAAAKGWGDGYGVNVAAFAGGGGVRGPGTGTSDSILARLSNGEFVQPAASVDYYGQGLMEAIRHRLLPREVLPGFARGGSVKYPFDVETRMAWVPTMDEVRAVALKAITGSRSTGGIGSSDMMRILRAVFPGLGLYSGYRPGSRTASGNLSYHAMIAADGDKGRAVDLPPKRSVFDWIHDNYFAGTRELIWAGDPNRNIWNGKHHRYSSSLLAQHGVAGQPNAHIHWAYDQGGYLPPGVSTVYNGTGRPEPVFTDGQWSQISTMLADRQQGGAARSEIHNHFDFANSTLDEARLNAITQRQDALNRLDRPNW